MLQRPLSFCFIVRYGFRKMKKLINSRASQNNSKRKEGVKGSRKPKPRGGDDKEEQSTAKSSRNTKRTNKKKNPAQSPAISPGPKSQVQPKKDKNDASIAEDEMIPGSAISTISTVSTVSTAGAMDLPPQTPPKKEVVASTRKTKAVHSDQPCQSSKNGHTPTEKWVGEAAAKSWMDKADFAKVKADFEKIQSASVNIEKDCKKWKSHSKLNQSDDYPALDANLVKVENEYVNMSQMDVPLGRGVLVGQLPVKNSEESFWKAVFEKRATHILVIIGTESYDFFPHKVEDYRNYGQMWINNRRVEQLNDDICRYLIEVLPHGCSNSIVCNLTVIKNWNIDSVHAKHSVVIKETIELTTFLSQATNEETALIISHHGAGRAGFFLSLSVAVNKLESKTEPCIADIVKKIRDQRPKAVETLTQYASLYISLFYFIKKKVVKVDGDKKASPSDPLGKKSVELTQSFTNSLIAEATQPSLMGSAMTDASIAGSTVMSLAISGQK
ncbi:hypothetical protein B9Z55_006466 [Caenorhabditis nigoni]|uniref:Tyrosine-protein phosphatase domain-containing protein n=1 Tax=Caenorhabditis nigoni TaxID=1611254 RepID=A0A2G5V5C8_9PELO|nr:hypothetical protein B9Z55_006466 [Caenorhabditis nigoni]